MRDMLTVAQLNGFVGQQTQGPVFIAFRRVTTGQGSHLGSLDPIDFGGPA